MGTKCCDGGRPPWCEYMEALRSLAEESRGEFCNRPPNVVCWIGWLRGRMPGGEAELGCCAYSPSRAPGEFWKVGGDAAMAMPPLLGDGWLVKKGTDLAHSFVYCAAPRVAPRADRSGDVVAL